MRDGIKQGNEKEKKKKKKRTPLNKKILQVLQLVNSAVSNLRLHCSSMPNIMKFTTFDRSDFLEFSLSNTKLLYQMFLIRSTPANYYIRCFF